MRGSQNSLTVLFFKDSRKSAYLQLVDKLSASLQIRRIKPVPLASSNLFKTIRPDTNKKNQNKNQARLKEKKEPFLYRCRQKSIYRFR